MHPVLLERRWLVRLAAVCMPDPPLVTTVLCNGGYIGTFCSTVRWQTDHPLQWQGVSMQLRNILLVDLKQHHLGKSTNNIP